MPDVKPESLFVYGTLLKGQSHGGLLGDSPRVAATTEGRLWSLPAGYPALGVGEGIVHGELVEIERPGLLSILDRYEGVDEGLYRRVKVDVLVGLRSREAWTYVMEDPRARGGKHIPEGRWSPIRRR